MRIRFPSGNIYTLNWSYNCAYFQDLMQMIDDDNPITIVRYEEVFRRLIIPQKVDIDILKIIPQNQVVHGLAYFGSHLIADFTLLCHHKKYNLESILKIQRFWRRYRKYKQFLKYINSIEFAKWIYQPSNIGAKTVINKLKNNTDFLY